MGRAFDDLKDGDTLEPFHLNIIYRELRRLRKMKAVPPMALDSMESADSPPILRQGGRSGVIVRGVVTTAIPTGTIGTPSTSGRATLYTWVTSVSAAGETGVQINNDNTITASVPNGTVIKAAFIDGDYWLISSECY